MIELARILRDRAEGDQALQLSSDGLARDVRHLGNGMSAGPAQASRIGFNQGVGIRHEDQTQDEENFVDLDLAFGANFPDRDKHSSEQQVTFASFLVFV